MKCHHGVRLDPAGLDEGITIMAIWLHQECESEDAWDWGGQDWPHHQ
jgi:hypothetical protein